MFLSGPNLVLRSVYLNPMVFIFPRDTHSASSRTRQPRIFLKVLLAPGANRNALMNFDRGYLSEKPCVRLRALVLSTARLPSGMCLCMSRAGQQATKSASSVYMPVLRTTVAASPAFAFSCFRNTRRFNDVVRHRHLLFLDGVASSLRTSCLRC